MRSKSRGALENRSIGHLHFLALIESQVSGSALKGTFGLCVAYPMDEAHIMRKKVLQEKLSKLSENGTKIVFTQAESGEFLALIDQFAQSAMPFSPIGYPLNSRKRFVDDFKACILARYTVLA